MPPPSKNDEFALKMTKKSSALCVNFFLLKIFACKGRWVIMQDKVPIKKFDGSEKLQDTIEIRYLSSFTLKLKKQCKHFPKIELLFFFLRLCLKISLETLRPRGGGLVVLENTVIVNVL